MSAAPKIVRRALHGVLLLHKPRGLTSNQALQKAKFLLRAQKAGHTGTLDPLASGLLPLCFGAATKFGQWQLEADKTYIAHMKLGQTTTTGDAEGELLAQRPVPPEVLQPGALAHVAARFCGEQMQTPPMHSALKKDGKPLYEYARAGVEVPRAARRITIHALEFLASNVNPLPLRVRCSKGTYIRTLVGDMGAALGCGAHLAALQRTHSGPFALERAISLEALEALPEAQRAAQLLPPEALLVDVPRIFLDAADAGRFLTGLRRTLPGQVPDCAAVAVFGRAPDAFLGLAHIAQGSLIPERLLNPLEIQQILQQEFSFKACPT